MEFNSLNTADGPPRVGDLIVIQRKIDKPEERILCKVRELVYGPNGKKIILSTKNDYFIWNMYRKGESWVWRVWNLGPVKLTEITNTMTKFPRR
jgi:hypothetical protein